MVASLTLYWHRVQKEGFPVTKSSRQSGRVGRRPSSSRDTIAAVAIELFAERGFDAVSIDDIADAAGIARRTFFRYFSSKNAVPWGDFDDRLIDFRNALARAPISVPTGEAIVAGIVEFNRLPADEVDIHRRRMDLILNTPALQAHSALMYRGWRYEVASFVAYRGDTSPTGFHARRAGWAALAASMTAYEQWLEEPDSDLSELLELAGRMGMTGLEVYV